MGIRADQDMMGERKIVEEARKRRTTTWTEEWVE